MFQSFILGSLLMFCLYLLNESKDPAVPGDLEIYRQLEDLVISTEAIDVRNGEYFAFVSDGRKIVLSADSVDSPVVAEIEDEPTHCKEVESLLRGYLEWCCDDGRFGVSRVAVDNAQGLAELTALIPETLVTEYQQRSTGVRSLLSRLFK